jgi:hypothetical protein
MPVLYFWNGGADIRVLFPCSKAFDDVKYLVAVHYSAGGKFV